MKITIDSNILKVLICVVKYNKLTTKEICEKTKLAWSTVFDNLVILEGMEEIIRSREKHYEGKGRPHTYWILN